MVWRTRIGYLVATTVLAGLTLCAGVGHDGVLTTLAAVVTVFVGSITVAYWVESAASLTELREIHDKIRLLDIQREECVERLAMLDQDRQTIARIRAAVAADNWQLIDLFAENQEAFQRSSHEVQIQMMKEWADRLNL
jgi:hypothetical protein